MRISICKQVILASICIIAGCRAWSQSINPEEQAPVLFDVAVTYNPVLANVTTGNEFGMQGGSLQAQSRVWHRLCAVADLAGLHTGNVNGSGVALDLIIVTFGPRYVWSPSHRRLVFFGQALVGEAHGMNSIFPSPTGTDSTGNSLALQVGGGINVPLTQRLSVRALDAGWLRTELPNATTNVQNNLRLGAGLVYRIR